MRARQLTSAAVKLERRVYGDIWLRDTGPLVLTDGQGNRAARRFGFNGWGGKYLMDGDQTVGAELARDADLPLLRLDRIAPGQHLRDHGVGRRLRLCARQVREEPAEGIAA